eukprot:TRINITY_DN9376_c0_g1_i1.p1 TRINITY_DN9376_c0_g1~~TRINITY_DN9376_c0_g1_i1.p1  ORF type:complete len:453 (-),score=71.96 TRINITY_DN9376_c0_g1_i1:44-1300(-)
MEPFRTSMWQPLASAPYAGVAHPRVNPTASRPQRIPHLFQPLQIAGSTLKNRIIAAPMCQYSSQDGFLNDWHLVHLGSIAKGGAALVIFEASAVQDIGRITPWDVGFWKDEHIAPAKRIVEFIHQHDTLAGIQLAHAGRKATAFPPMLTFERPRVGMSDEQGGWDSVGPSGLAFDSDSRKPQELSKEQIAEVIEAFVAATKRAVAAGFDVVEIHGAHGYLISSFNSPIANKRTDEYGGSFEGRTRLCVEIVRAVRAVWPTEKALWVRLSCTDWYDGESDAASEEQWDIEQTIRLARILRQEGVDVLHCSSGGQTPLQKMPVYPGYQVPLAEAVKRAIQEDDKALGKDSTAKPFYVTAVGLITSAKQAEEIIGNGRADIVGLARPLLDDPFLPLHFAKELEVDLHWPPAYEWSINRPRH